MSMHIVQVYKVCVFMFLGLHSHVDTTSCCIFERGHLCSRSYCIHYTLLHVHVLCTCSYMYVCVIQGTFSIRVGALPMIRDLIYEVAKTVCHSRHMNSCRDIQTIFMYEYIVSLYADSRSRPNNRSCMSFRSVDSKNARTICERN